MLMASSIFSLFIFAVAIRCSMRLMYGMRRANEGDAIQSVLSIMSWTCLIASLLGISFSMVFIIPLWLLVPFVVLSAWVRRRQMQRKALLALIATVVEKDLPPGPALAAFAEGHRGSIGRSASRMARMLNEGSQMPAAMTASANALPLFTQTFVQAGEVSGNVVPAIREVNRLKSPGQVVAQSLAGRLFYLLFVAIWWTSITTFILTWILPKFRDIFYDFGVELPDSTQTLISASTWAIDFSFLIYPFVLVFTLIPMAYLFLWKLYDFQWISGVPMLERLDTSFHRAVILRSLALAADSGHPLVPVLRSLSMNYPRAFIGKRLWEVAGEVEAGEPWYESMEREKLLTTSDVAILKNAERVGNLAWAMRMVADRGLRISAYRIQALLNWVSPLIVLVIGLGIMFFATGMFLPLVQIIQALV